MIVVYDILGQQFFSKENNPKELDISNLYNGMYFLYITTDNGSFVKKILKN